MMIMGVFLVLVASIALLWLKRQGVLASTWLVEGSGGETRSFAATPPPAAKIGLGVFLAVVGALFALLASAYYMRMAGPDWQQTPPLGVLWFSTLALTASSAALHMAQQAARRRDAEKLRLFILAAGVTAVAFLLGQLWAWRELASLGYYAAGNPANAFFYLATGLHGLHILGGLVALGFAFAKAWRDDAGATLATELCAAYWHFLLLVWLLLFAMLTGWGNELGAICRRLLG